MEMCVEIPGFLKSHDKKPTEALHRFIGRLEGPRGTELTDTQAEALVKIAEALISSIQKSQGGSR
jgi:hypothetical protein